MGREIERQRPKNCSSDGLTVRYADASAAVVSLVPTNGQNYMDFPAFQSGWGRGKRGLEVREE